ncbi:quinoprotein glucose dehydrogenase [Sutcliffiella horikoshii]|uniref:Quinoprotein glucose dehydrogenase n=1 Tax=Sutcliffiella horikoshii TaxID=79883 RepID=A0ABM6KJU1_9BACI|nr:quinoprotein glucose dehydrogenase [Sutcliffiella horikoshii]
MKNFMLTITLLSVFITGCNSVVEPKNNNEVLETNATPDKDVKTQQFSVDNKEVIATNLNVPWSITKSGDVFFITERTGKILKIDKAGMTREDVQLDKQLLVYGEGGLLGMELHPDFQENGLAFAYHTYGTEEAVNNRIVTLKYDGTAWKETEVLLENIDGAIFHNGGRIKVGPDDKLYVTVGDANEPESAQNQELLTGSILRLNLDGTVPEDNPIPGSYVYSYGHRNPQGLAWDKDTGEMYASEHGPSAFDEINLIKKGKNYGWPTYTGEEHAEEVEAPLFHSGTDTWAPSGIFVENGILYAASLRGEMVRAFDISSKQQSVLWKENGRIRDVWKEGDSIYFITNNTDGRGNPVPEDDQLIRLDLSLD